MTTRTAIPTPPPATPVTTAPPPVSNAVAAVKVYGGGATAVCALDGVTVGFPARRFTAIMGPSGSGKSTLMHCLAGLDTAHLGCRSYLGDVELGALSDKRAHPAAAASASASCSRPSTCCRR